MFEWAGGCCEGRIIAVGNRRIAIKMECGGTEIMITDFAELERRKYIVLPAKPKTWLQRLLTPNEKLTREANDEMRGR